MKPVKQLLFTLVVAGSLCLLPSSQAEAQLYVGAHGSLSEVNRTAWGLGGRLGTVIHQSPELTLAVEGVGEYLWPSCDLVDCNAVVLQANLLARRGVANYAEVYAGLGVVYENFTIEDDQNRHKGDDLGFGVLAGTQSGQPGSVRPFLEVRYTWMGDLENQAGVSLGIRVPVG